MRSHSGIRTDLFKRPLNETLITDFFGGVAQVQVTDDIVLEPGDDELYSLDSDSVESRPPQEDSSAPTETPSSSEDNITITPGDLRPPKLDVSTDRFSIPTLAPQGFTPSLRSWMSLIAIGCIVGWISRSSS